MIELLTTPKLSRVSIFKAVGRNFGSGIFLAVGQSLKAQIALMGRRTPKVVGPER